MGSAWSCARAHSTRPNTPRTTCGKVIPMAQRLSAAGPHAPLVARLDSGFDSAALTAEIASAQANWRQCHANYPPPRHRATFGDRNRAGLHRLWPKSATQARRPCWGHEFRIKAGSMGHLHDEDIKNRLVFQLDFHNIVLPPIAKRRSMAYFSGGALLAPRTGEGPVALYSHSSHRLGGIHRPAVLNMSPEPVCPNNPAEPPHSLRSWEDENVSENVH